jgi:outer membrane protein assembly factor BamB
MMGRNCVRIFLLCAGMTPLTAQAQTPQSMTVSPDKATMLVGETRTFRAVGKDGRIRHNVRWGISPQSAASITANGDEVTVQAQGASPSVLLTASAEGDSADASIEIRPAGDMPAGTRIWSVSPTPGCKATKMTQAVPSANGPDLYVEESCPDGSMIRALTSDGRELWRRPFGAAGTPSSAATPIQHGALIGILPGGAASSVPSKSNETAGAHINTHATSVCDEIAVGMSRDDVSKTASGRDLSIDKRQQNGDLWTIEEEGFRCTILFDATAGTVVKKKKIVVTE